MGVIGALAFVVALLLSVMVHEYGHYSTARRYGMHVTEFFLGFGQRLWSTKRGETEFGIKVIPAGGYCKISGMSPREQLAPEIEHRAFYKSTVRRKLVVLGSGSFLHFILGLILLFLLFVGFGTSQPSSVISQVVPCVPSSDQCLETDPKSPANIAGLKAGDKIIALDSAQEMSWPEISKILRSSPNRQVTLTIKRDDRVENLTLTLAERKVDGEVRGYLGIINSYALVRQNPVTALSSTLSTGWQITEGSFRGLINLPTQIPSLFRQTFLGEARTSDGLVGVVGVARATGETVASGNLTTPEKVATFLLIVASLNIFVGIFNLLPILPLDGGHMAVAIYEAFRRRRARRLGRPDPGPVDVENLTPVTMVVFVLLVVLTMLLLVADIFNPIKLNL